MTLNDEIVEKTKKIKIWKGLTLFELLAIIAFIVVSIVSCSTIHTLTTTSSAERHENGFTTTTTVQEDVQTISFKHNKDKN